MYLGAGYFARQIDFSKSDVKGVVEELKAYVPDAGISQVRAWRDSVMILKAASDDFLTQKPPGVDTSSIILEYTVPLESRRIDTILILSGVVVVIEFKGKDKPSQADIDQAAAYARDLRAYHKMCTDVPVICLLVLTGYRGDPVRRSEVDLVVR